MNIRPRHLFITGGYPPQRGIFAHRALVQLRPYVDTRVVRLFAMRPGRLRRTSWEVDGIPVVSAGALFLPGLNSNRHLLPLAAWSSASEVRQLLEEADIVEVNSVYPIGEVVREWLERLHLNKPLVAGATGDDAMVYLPRLYKQDPRWVERLLGAFDGFLSNSEVMAKRLERFFPGGPRAFTARRGVDFSQFHPAVTPTGPTASVASFRFLFLGGFQTWNGRRMDSLNVKGGHVLMKAWNQVELQNDSAHLCIAGPGSEVQQVKEWRKGLRFPERVHLYPGGTIAPDDVPGVLRAADCLVIPSLSEGIPNVANEAQACAVPVLGTDAGGTPESVLDGQTGKIVRRGSVEALVDGMLWCAGHPTELRAMGERGSQRMRKDFDWSGFVKVALEAYALALNKKGSARMAEMLAEAAVRLSGESMAVARS